MFHSVGLFREGFLKVWSNDFLHLAHGASPLTPSYHSEPYYDTGRGSLCIRRVHPCSGAFMRPKGIEPLPQAPEAYVLSIGPRARMTSVLYIARVFYATGGRVGGATRGDVGSGGGDLRGRTVKTGSQLARLSKLSVVCGLQGWAPGVA